MIHACVPANYPEFVEWFRAIGIDDPERVKRFDLDIGVDEGVTAEVEYVVSDKQLDKTKSPLKSHMLFQLRRDAK